MEIETGNLEVQVGSAILTAGHAFADPHWRLWAARWLGGTDRTEASAHLAFDIADAEVAERGVGPAPPASPSPAVAARTATQLAIGFARVEGLREIGAGRLACSLAHTTAALAAHLSSVPAHAHQAFD